MNVEVRHLRALVALAESDTFTTAAAILGTTQPTLSRTITQLEEITGARLVERTTRTMTLTRAGSQLARAAVDLLADLDTALAQLHDPATRPLRLGWAWAGFGHHTVPLLQQWTQAHTGTVEPVRPADPVQALRHGRIDAALIRTLATADPAHSDLVSLTLFTEKLVAALPAADPRSEKTSVTLLELSEGPLAVCATAPTATANLWAHHGPSPRTVRVANTDEWLARITLGQAVGVTAEATTYNHQSPEVTYLPIEDAPLAQARLLWPAAGAHPQAQPFAHFAHAYFQNLIRASSPPLMLAADASTD